MSKTTMTAMLAAMLVLSMPAYAQTTSTPSTAPAARGAAMHQLQPGQIRGSEMIGSSVYDAQNRDIGKIKDVILDHQGRVDSVVIDVGEQARAAGADAGATAQDLARRGREQAAAASDALYQQGMRAGEYLTENVNEYPLTALLIAGVIGYGIAFLIHARWQTPG